MERAEWFCAGNHEDEGRVVREGEVVYNEPVFLDLYGLTAGVIPIKNGSIGIVSLRALTKLQVWQLWPLCSHIHHFSLLACPMHVLQNA